jgi:hypothetical protein
LGLKSRVFDDRLQFNAEIFDSTFRNRGQQGTVTVGNVTSAACVAALQGMNAPQVASDYSCGSFGGMGGLTIPKLKSRGVDIEVNWLPTAADRIDFNIEYLDAKQNAPVSATAVTALLIENAALAAQNPGCGGPPPSPACPVATVATAGSNALLAAYNSRVAIYEGATLQSSPKFSANLSYKHDFMLASGARLSPTLNLAYKSSYWTSFDLPAPYSPQSPGPAGQNAYSIYNFNLNWSSADNKFNITAYMKNIGNKPVLLNFEGGGFRGASDVSLGDPRTTGVILSINY